MAIVRVKGRIDKDGRLTAMMPLTTANQTVEVLVDFSERNPVAESELLNLLEGAFGMLPELKRADQGELPPSKSW